MIDQFPDPSLVNSIDFYSSAFMIKRLMRRRGWQNVAPMGGDLNGFMPRDLYQKWDGYQTRKQLIKEKNGGKEFERYVAQVICQWYCNPATFSNKVLDLSPGGDFDVLVEGPGEHLFYFETKTSLEGTVKSTNIEGIWNFMVREASLEADMSVFLYDSNQKLDRLLIPIFRILYSLAEFVSTERKKEPLDIDSWIKGLNSIDHSRIGRRIGGLEMYFMYWPVIVIAGGKHVKKNIGEAISLYYGGIRHISPFETLSRRPTREVFLTLQNWNRLPKDVKGKITDEQVIKWAEMYKKNNQTLPGS